VRSKGCGYRHNKGVRLAGSGVKNRASGFTGCKKNIAGGPGRRPYHAPRAASHLQQQICGFSTRTKPTRLQQVQLCIGLGCGESVFRGVFRGGAIDAKGIHRLSKGKANYGAMYDKKQQEKPFDVPCIPNDLVPILLSQPVVFRGLELLGAAQSQPHMTDQTFESRDSECAEVWGQVLSLRSHSSWL